MCDTLCVRHDGGMLFAKNSDRHPDEVQIVEWHARAARRRRTATRSTSRLPDPDAHAFVGSRPTWLWGVEHGVNEHGVAIGNEKIWTVDRPRDAPGRAARYGPRAARPRTGAHCRRSARRSSRRSSSSTDRADRANRISDEPYDSSFLFADARGRLGRRDMQSHVGGASRRRTVPRSRIASSLTTDWTRASADIAAGTTSTASAIRRSRPRSPTAGSRQRARASPRRGCNARVELAATIARSQRRRCSPTTIFTSACTARKCRRRRPRR